MLCNTYKMTVGPMHSVTLYHWEPNANSGKPMLALMEKGVAFESHYLDLLKFDQHQPDYLAINPQGTIPAMLHGERVLTESTDRKSTRLNSSHLVISYAVFCLKKKTPHSYREAFTSASSKRPYSAPYIRHSFLSTRPQVRSYCVL